MMINNKYLKISGIIVFFAILALGFVLYSQRQNDFVDLQKEILNSSNEIEKLNTIERLHEVYLHFSIPDSIKQNVRNKLHILKASVTNYKVPSMPEVDDLYQLESYLEEVIHFSITMKWCGADSTFHQSLENVSPLACKLDRSLNTNFWCPYLQKIKEINKHQAEKWLLAKQAAFLCSENHLSKFSLADLYGAYGLKLLKDVSNPRLSLDIYQRLLTILYRFHGMYDLTYPLALKLVSDADSMRYHLRAVGFCYHYANACFLAGHNELALEYFKNTCSRAEQHASIQGIKWYRRYGQLGIAKYLWQSGYYQKSLQICDVIEKDTLDHMDKVELYITRGLNHRCLGNYEKALNEYKKTLQLCRREDDFSNEIVVLQNLGTFHSRLTEYDKAELYYSEALKLLRTRNPKNIEQKSRLLICLAEDKAAQNEIKEFNRLSKAAHDLIKLINLPTTKAELLRSMGKVDIQIGRYKEAYQECIQALQLYENSGWTRAALETNISLIQCDMDLKKYDEAKELAFTLLEAARKYQDEQRQVDAIGYLARIADKQGQIDEAIEFSNRLIEKVEQLSQGFSDDDYLKIFRQKSYDYLKDAVQYEIKNKEIEKAFIKLNYLKSSSSKALNFSGVDNAHFIDVINVQKNLHDNELIIHYLVTQDTLYAFVLDKITLQLLKHAIGRDELSSIVAKFDTTISNTIKVLDSQSPSNFTTHYDTTSLLGKNLYQALVGWPELQTKIDNAHITYIIPDDILYEVPFACLMKSGDEFLVHQTAVVYMPAIVFKKYEDSKVLKKMTSQNKIMYSVSRQFNKTNDLIEFIKNNFSFKQELTVSKPVALKEDILSELNKGYDIYIILGHSCMNKKFPEFSYIEVTMLNSQNSSFQTVELTVDELKTINWDQTNAILLIGCETARGKAYKGYGLAGIQQCLLSLGVNEVLGSQWKIDANSTNIQIKDILIHYLQTENFTIALQKAQLNAIQKLQKDYYYKKAHPYMWASFSLAKNFIN